MILIAQGCPVADGKPPCHMCGGYYKISSERFSLALYRGNINPEKLCGPMRDEANRIYALYKDLGMPRRDVVLQMKEEQKGQKGVQS